jgi:dihydroneopterin aldolase
VSVHEEVSLRGLRFHTTVGILPHEREHPQALEADITVWRVPAAPGEDVLDYRRLHALVAGHVAGVEDRYLETAAHAIAEAALREHGVERVRVVLRKPQVTLPGPLDAAEVAVERSRAP